MEIDKILNDIDSKLKAFNSEIDNACTEISEAPDFLSKNRARDRCHTSISSKCKWRKSINTAIIDIIEVIKEIRDK